MLTGDIIMSRKHTLNGFENMVDTTNLAMLKALPTYNMIKQDNNQLIWHE